MEDFENKFAFTNSTVKDQCYGDDILDLEFATDERTSIFMYSATERLIILTLYPISLIIGLTGNIFFLLVLACVPEMRTITNFYLGNLAVADIFFLSALNYDVLVGYMLSPYVKMKPYWSSAGCGLRICVQFTSHVTIVGLILLVTVERYFGICKPLQHRMIVAKGRTLKLVMTAWFVGLMFSAMVVPKAAIFKSTCIVWPKTSMYEHLPMRLKSCNPVLPIFEMFHDILLIPLVTVLIINMILYGKIIHALNDRVAITKPGKDKAAKAITDATVSMKVRRVRNQVARLLIATGTFFFFCCVPEFTVHLNRLMLTLTNNEVGFTMTPRQKWYVLWLVRGMTTTSAVINPIIYGLTNERYLKAFTKVFTCGFVSSQGLGRSSGSAKTSSSIASGRSSKKYVSKQDSAASFEA